LSIVEEEEDDELNYSRAKANQLTLILEEDQNNNDDGNGVDGISEVPSDLPSTTAALSQSTRNMLDGKRFLKN